MLVNARLLIPLYSLRMTPVQHSYATSRLLLWLLMSMYRRRLPR